MSNVPLGHAMGLRVHRELIGREMRAAAEWENLYGNEALTRHPDASQLQNLGKFEKLASMPMPLEVQLRMLQAQRVAQAATISKFEGRTYPHKAAYPVSALSVSIFGDAAWHSQRPDGRKPPGHPGSYEPLPCPQLDPFNTMRRFNVNGTCFHRVSMGAAHVEARNRARAMTSHLPKRAMSKLDGTVAQLTTPVGELAAASSRSIPGESPCNNDA
ncbi:hypothetical protein AB1Y20_011630 [Prymnesium parvum]|uniref:Uncharacterized protein n=1 Tax=Prymnesium parvum TaxID=97485 RepID=A0AB34IH32_PRYPA